MRALVFAGGSGRRLWPISRIHSPKQFEPIMDGQSTLQLGVGRIQGSLGLENIYVATNSCYREIVRDQLPALSESNIILEPDRRDLGPAVGLALAHLDPNLAHEPIGLLWSDNVIEDVATFLSLLAGAEQLVTRGDADIVYLGETPRFANENLGWIELKGEAGQVNNLPFHGFGSITYRPQNDVCEEMFASGRYVWNTGIFVTTPAYINEMYRQHVPDMWQQLQVIAAAIGKPDYQTVLKNTYSSLSAISFDDAILVHLDPARAQVMHSDMGWSDPGTLYALKEMVSPDPEDNAVQGLVRTADTRDSLIYNYESEKLVMTVGLDGFVVVNTKDALVVVHKDQIPNLKEVLNNLEGTDLESFG